MVKISDDGFAENSKDVVLYDGNHCLIRHLQSHDEIALREMFAQCGVSDVYLRCFAAIKDFPKAMATRLCGYDERREIALVATKPASEPDIGILGVAHVILSNEPDLVAEFDVMVRTDLKGHGIGYALMSTLLIEARSRGFAAVTGFILQGNPVMLQMAGELGFKVDRIVGGVAEVSVVFETLG